MSKQEFASHLSLSEQPKAVEEQAVLTQCQEACDDLDREICLQNLVEKLGIDCTSQEKSLLIQI